MQPSLLIPSVFLLGMLSTAVTIAAQLDSEAVAVVSSEINARVLHTPDGLVSRIPRYTSLFPNWFQYSNLKYTYSPKPLSDADKLNGIQYIAVVKFGPHAVRTRNSIDNRWSEWRDGEKVCYLEKKNGHWRLIEPGSNSSCFDTKPTLEEYRATIQASGSTSQSERPAVAGSTIEGKWYDGGPNCVDVSRATKRDSYRVKVYYCSVGAENANDMVVFPKEQGYVDKDGKVMLKQTDLNTLEVNASPKIVDKLGNPYTLLRTTFKRQ